MINRDITQVENEGIERALKRANARYGLVRPNVATASTLPGARQQIIIDPETMAPLEEDTGGVFYPGYVPSEPGRFPK